MALRLSGRRNPRQLRTNVARVYSSDRTCMLTDTNFAEKNYSRLVERSIQLYLIPSHPVHDRKSARHFESIECDAREHGQGPRVL